MTATLAVDPLYLDRPDRNALARTLTRAAACAAAHVAAVLDELAPVGRGQLAARKPNPADGPGQPWTQAP